MSIIRKFEVSTVVEITDAATDEERALDDEAIPSIIRASAVSEAQRILVRWLAGDREYIAVSINEVP